MSDGFVLVTGADGFIGSHLVEALVKRGKAVRAFVQYNSFNSWGWLDHAPPEALRGVDVVAGDIRDFASIRAAMKGCDTVFHLAALIAIPYSYQAPQTYIDTNITGTLNILQAARELGVSKVVHTSTSEVYGTARFVPITEEHPLCAQSPYAASKIGADQMALACHLSFGTPVAIARPFNTYGPRQSARAVIPTIITQALSGRPGIKLGAAHTTRDFNYVQDTVAGFLAVADSPNSIGQTINIGSNFEISIAETVAVVAEVIGVPLDIFSEQARVRPADSEVERLWADNSKARVLLGWEPRYGGRAGFMRGIAETVDWFRDPKNVASYKSDRYNV
ncbi:NAD-dependent 4,6-dehydratase LegB [Azospirillum doebereinerae]|uniref:NAD-dependent 4,6-dehydratase LegB n=1 Tax=Azospirillum doebereinerae TaxID=92933 RepID=UPI001EE50766|nr:NAD-dependent 4,6-dehydratase LegB [Azospirillum doebereinerae]MCG5238921.1 NAD-dependent 4,6-dehydratase LegB [Azospirillum doebereinerae]